MGRVSTEGLFLNAGAGGQGLFTYLLFMYTHTHTYTHTQVSGPPLQSWFTSTIWLRDQAETVRLGDKSLYPVSHLIGSG